MIVGKSQNLKCCNEPTSVLPLAFMAILIITIDFKEIYIINLKS